MRSGFDFVGPSWSHLFTSLKNLRNHYHSFDLISQAVDRRATLGLFAAAAALAGAKPSEAAYGDAARVFAGKVTNKSGMLIIILALIEQPIQGSVPVMDCFILASSQLLS